MGKRYAQTVITYRYVGYLGKLKEHQLQFNAKTKCHLHANVWCGIILPHLTPV